MSNSNNPDHDAYERMFPSFHTRLAKEQREAEEGIVDLGHLRPEAALDFLAALQQRGPVHPDRPGQRFRLPDGQVVGFDPKRRVFIYDPRTWKSPDDADARSTPVAR
jgi:hypothetical protein